MKNLGTFKNSLLMTAVALSLFSSPARATTEKYVSEEDVTNLENPDPYPSFQTSLSNVVINTLTKLDKEQWKQFKNSANFLSEGFYTTSARPKIISALALLVDNAILFHPEFSKGVSDFLKCIPDIKVRESAISVISINPDLFGTQPFCYAAFFKRLKEVYRFKEDRSRPPLLYSLSEVDEKLINNPNFPFQALSQMIPHPNPIPNCDLRYNFISRTDGGLAHVPKDKADRVYGQIQRLMREAPGRLQVISHSAPLLDLVDKLQSAESDEVAKNFVGHLIANESVPTESFIIDRYLNPAWKKRHAPPTVQTDDQQPQRGLVPNSSVVQEEDLNKSKY